MKDSRSCSRSTDSPGARTVKALRPFSAAVLSEYFALMPVNCGAAPAELPMRNVFAGSVLSAEFGSLKSLSVSSPVFVIVVTTFRFSTSVTSEGPATLRDTDWVAEAVIAESATEASAALRVAENILASGTTGRGRAQRLGDHPWHRRQLIYVTHARCPLEAQGQPRPPLPLMSIESAHVAIRGSLCKALIKRRCGQHMGGSSPGAGRGVPSSERRGATGGILACGVGVTGLRSRDGQLDELLASSPRGEQKMGRWTNSRWTAWV